MKEVALQDMGLFLSIFENCILHKRIDICEMHL